MDELASHGDEDLPLQHSDAGSNAGVAAYLRDRASPYTARVSAWWIEVITPEGCKPMSYYDQ
jgi:hypothetical protein